MENNLLPHNHGHQIDLQNMPEETDFQAAAEIFKTICDQSRMRIFWILCHFEECVINLAYIVNMSSPAVSHHLRQLKESGLITSRRVGKEVYYKAANTKKAQLIHKTIEKIIEISCPEL